MENTSKRKPLILAVDDDEAVLAALVEDLRRRYGSDYRIVRAASGEESLEILEERASRKESLALVVSDQRMPGMQGTELLAKLKDSYPDAKRVLLTAYADTEAAIRAINASRIDYYLVKPWDPPEEKLFPVLDDLLGSWRATWRPSFEGVQVIGDRWSAHTHTLKDFLARNHVPYRFRDVEQDPSCQEYLVDQPDLKLPLVVLPDGQRINAPETTDLAAQIGLQTRAEEDFYDLVIVGAGPAGLAAAVYGGSEGLRTVMIELEAPGGQAGTSSLIENYLGFPAGLSGAELARRAVTQAKRFDVEILTPQAATGLREQNGYKYIRLSDAREIACHALVISSGVRWRRLEVPGAERLTGSGLYYGAAMSEAHLCRDKRIYVAGAGNSAGQAALYFAGFAREVVMLVRGDSLEAKMSEYLVKRIGETENITVQLETEIVACEGEEHLKWIRTKHNGQEEVLDTDYLFVFIGAVPCTEWTGDLIARDPEGFILTGPDLDRRRHLKGWPLDRDPYLLEACVPGVFAAGDVRHSSIKRVASAVGEGSIAIHFIHQYLATL